MSQPLIRRLDQITIAALTAIAVAGVFTWWLANEGHRGALIEIENAPPLNYRFLVDLNGAEWPEQAQLPGIGPRKLEAMRRYLLLIVDDTQVAEKKEELDADERELSG